MPMRMFVQFRTLLSLSICLVQLLTLSRSVVCFASSGEMADTDILAPTGSYKLQCPVRDDLSKCMVVHELPVMVDALECMTAKLIQFT